jgi:OOP family OmpA-OmpF porin
VSLGAASVTARTEPRITCERRPIWDTLGIAMEKRKRQTPGARRASRARSAAAAVVVLAAMPLAAGCGSHRLSPNPLPGADDHSKSLPRWYPEAPWTASAGDSRVWIEGKIVFDTDKAIIRPGSEKVLGTLLKFLQEHTEVTALRVEGHTDNRASDEHNLELSARRSLAVCDWLVDHGVDNMRLVAVGFGKTKPIAPNEVADGRSENRRTEFHVAEVDGHLFLGKDPTAGGYVLDVLSLEDRKAQAMKANTTGRSLGLSRWGRFAGFAWFQATPQVGRWACLDGAVLPALRGSKQHHR